MRRSPLPGASVVNAVVPANDPSCSGYQHYRVRPLTAGWATRRCRLGGAFTDCPALRLGAHPCRVRRGDSARCGRTRSEEDTSELQSLRHLVCRLLLEKNKKEIVTCVALFWHIAIEQGHLSGDAN